MENKDTLYLTDFSQIDFRCPMCRKGTVHIISKIDELFTTTCDNEMCKFEIVTRPCKAGALKIANMLIAGLQTDENQIGIRINKNM